MAVQKFQEIYENLSGYDSNFSIATAIIQHGQVLEEAVGELTKIRKSLQKPIEIPMSPQEEAHYKEVFKNLRLFDKEELFDKIKGMFTGIYKELSTSYTNVEIHVSAEEIHNQRHKILTKYQEELLALLNLPRD